MQWKIYYKIENNAVQILRCIGDGDRITIPASVQGFPVVELGEYCFAGSKSLENFNSQEPLYLNEQPPVRSVYNNNTLKYIHLPNTIKKLDNYCFAKCNALCLLELPQELEYIGHHCFHYCNKLTRMELPQGITNLYDYTFAECRSMTHITLSNNIQTIGRCCFYNCTHLQELYLPDELTSIGDRMLMNCFELKRLSFKIGLNGGALLAEIDRVMRVSVRYPDETVEIVLTEYALEYEELIQAKQFRTNETGTGGLYRGCFSDRDVDFALYDTYFYSAKLQDPPELLVELAYDRLKYPKDLRLAKADEYKKYIKEHIKETAAFLLREDDLSKLDFLIENEIFDANDITALLNEVQNGNNVRFVSRLLDISGVAKSNFGADKLFEL